jgi:hypothetical protein
MKGTYLSDLTLLAKAERKVAVHADRACGRLNRMEDLDEEQRSEMYAILQALKHDAQTDAQALDLLLGSHSQESANA